MRDMIHKRQKYREVLGNKSLGADKRRKPSEQKAIWSLGIRLVNAKR